MKGYEYALTAMRKLWPSWLVSGTSRTGLFRYLPYVTAEYWNGSSESYYVVYPVPDSRQPTINPSVNVGQTKGEIMASQNNNHFSGLISKVQNAPQALRTETLIEGIAQQMSQNDVTTQELGQELRQMENQLVRACQA